MISLNNVWVPNILSLNDHSTSFRKQIPPNFQYNNSESLSPIKTGKRNSINNINSIPPTFELNTNSSNRRKFTPEEDIKLSKMITIHGPKKWNQIALALPGRTGRQCRDRFQNYLNPSLTNGPWTREEDELLEQKVLELGQHWNKIAKLFKGRSSNNVKNRWYTYICKQKKDNRQTFSPIDTEKNLTNSDYQLEEEGPCNVCINRKNCAINDESINYSNGLIDNFVKINEEISSKIENRNNSDFAKNIGLNEIWTKTKNLKKMPFPPIYPPNDIYIFPSNQGMFDFLNQEIGS